MTRQQKRAAKKRNNKELDKVRNHLKRYFDNYHKYDKPVFHGLFGWCMIAGPIDEKGMIRLNLQSEMVSYLDSDNKSVVYKRDENGNNFIIHTPLYLYRNESQVPVSMGLIRMKYKVNIE